MNDLFISKILETLVDLGYFGIYLSSLGLFPSEIVIAIFAATPDANILLICLATCLGALTGAYPTYAIGYFFKEEVFYKLLTGKGRFLNIKVEKIEESKKNIAKRGWIYVMITRMVPWLRVVSSIGAGFIKVNIFQYTLGIVLGTFLYTLIVIYIGQEVGHSWELIVKYLNRIDRSVIALLLGYILLSVTYKSRRKLIKRLERTL
jgi:membrane protein DedA with SNARE-associated domain